MRITTAMLYRTGLFELGATRQRLAALQEQASTGRRINRPSDDPVGVRAASILKDGIAQTKRYQRTVDLARSRISTTEQALASSTDVMIRAREIAIQGANGSQSAESRKALASEVESLFDQLFRDANARVPGGGGYVFGGIASENQPFDRPGWTGWDAATPSPTVDFVGDSSQIKVDIDQGVEVPVTLDGEAVFKTGPRDLFKVLGDLRDALRTNDQVAIGTAIDDVEVAQKHLSLERTRIGASDAQADLWSNRLALQVQDLTQQLSLTEDADSIEVYSNLVQGEAALNASLEVNARLMQPSLLNFL